MIIQRVWACFFSPTGTGKTIATVIGNTLASHAGVPLQCFDFTTVKKRQAPPIFSQGDLVVFATPVYAGRVPNLLVDYIASAQGNGAMAVPVVLYGNRAFDDALMELRNTLEQGGFHTVAGGAFIGEHSFGRDLAPGRPDKSDQTIAKGFADQIFHKVAQLKDFSKHQPVFVPGNNPVQPYYRPKGPQGEHIDIRKVKPKTMDTCTDCLLCIAHCPMGSIGPEDPRLVPGLCIKCNACVKICPAGAKFFDDPNYLFHRDDLVEKFASPRKEPSFFL